MSQLILYACPVGPLAARLETYFERSQALCGPNPAHAYMPHCTLTGFFSDEAGAIARYTQVLDSIFVERRQTLPEPSIQIQQLIFRPAWYGLSLSSDWLKQLTAAFATQATSSTRQAPLRLKDWLHLSLAYDFDPDSESTLKHLANTLIDISLPVSWELRLYERSANNQWHCHRSYALLQS